jgi:hypothetical protein
MSKLDIIAVATALAFTAGSAIGGQQFGRDSVTVQPGQRMHSSQANVAVVRLGRDSVYVTRDTRLSTPGAVNVGTIVLKPGRA